MHYSKGDESTTLPVQHVYSKKTLIKRKHKFVPLYVPNLLIYNKGAIVNISLIWYYTEPRKQNGQLTNVSAKLDT